MALLFYHDEFDVQFISMSSNPLKVQHFFMVWDYWQVYLRPNHIVARDYHLSYSKWNWVSSLQKLSVLTMIPIIKIVDLSGCSRVYTWETMAFSHWIVGKFLVRLRPYFHTIHIWWKQSEFYDYKHVVIFLIILEPI